MTSNMAYVTKTEIYQKVKKPLLERQRRARMNKCLDALKKMMAEFRRDEEIMRMDRAEMLEMTLAYMRKQHKEKTTASSKNFEPAPLSNFKHGYMNAVNEVSRVLASTPGMTVEMGKSVMTHLGRVYNRLQKQHERQQKHWQYWQQQHQPQALIIDCTSPASPASSGYQSDYDSPAASPVSSALLWRPW